MKLLLDTNVVIWFASGDQRAGAVRDVIVEPANAILVSTVSLWEVAIKVRIGKLRLDVSGLVRQLHANRFSLVELRATHVERLAALPWFADHRDPFDHLLLAQAACEGATFVSADRHASRYGVPVLAA